MQCLLQFLPIWCQMCSGVPIKYANIIQNINNPISSMDIECVKQLEQFKQDYMWNSGKFFAQMGLYQDCLELPNNSSYFMANFINNITRNNASLYLGLCLPAVCDKDSIKLYLNAELQENKVLIMNMLNTTLAVGSVDVNPQSYEFQFSGWFYFTLIFLAVLVVMSVFSWIHSRRPKKQKYSTVDKIIQSFNFKESMKIFTYKSNYLNIFNGIKVMSMFWVIFGHQFSVRLKYDVNIVGLAGQVEKFFYLFVVGAFLAVDVFFFIGGFLVAYSFMRQKSKSILKYPMAIVHRVLRFWPSYITAILIYYSVYIHTGNGPLWKQNMTLGQIPYCDGAWKSILFVDNLVDNGERMCMAWGWYLQNDMQIFIFSLFFIFLYVKNRYAGYAALGAMMITGLTFNFIEVLNRQIVQVTHLKDFAKWNDYFINIYIKPWVRCPPYILGLILGLLHMEYLQARKQMKDCHSTVSQNFFVKMRTRMLQKRWIAWVCQLLGLAFMLTTIILPHDLQVGNTWPQWGHAFYLSIQKISFTFGIYLLILPTMLQVPNISFFLLDTKFFNALSKISFWTYLIHFMIVEFMSYGQKVDFYYTSATIIPIYIAIALLSLFFGFLGTILVEVPFSKLQKMMFTVLLKKSGDRPKKVVQNDSIVVNQKDSVAIALKDLAKGNSSLLSNDSIEQKLLRQPGINRSVKEELY